MSEVKVAAAEEALAKVAGVIGALPESGRTQALIKASGLLAKAAEISKLPEDGRAKAVADFLAGRDGELRKAVAEAAGLTVAEPPAADAGTEGADKPTEGADKPTEGAEDDADPELEALVNTIEGLTDDELAALGLVRVEDGTADLPEEFWDVVDQMTDEEIELAQQYLAEAQKLDDAAEGEPMRKVDEMAEVWLERGDVELKKFIAGALGAVKAAGKFSGAAATRARSYAGAAGNTAGAVAGAARSRLGAVFGAGRAGASARISAKSKVLSNRAALGAGMGGRPAGFDARSKALGQAAANKVGATQRRNRGIAGAAIGTGVLGGGGALASRRKD